MRLLKQSTAASVMVFMTDSTDHVTGKAGLTLTITASKNGAAFGSISPTVNDRGSGWYEIQLTTGNTDTLGDLALHITSTGADPTDTLSYVVVRHLADLAFPATSGRSLAVEADGMVYADLREWVGSAPLALASQMVQTLVGAMSAGVIDAAAIATDAIDGDAIATSAVTEIQSGLALASALATVESYVDTEIGDILSRLPAALVGGRMDASVGAMAAGVVTAAAVATDAIDGDAIAASAVSEIQSGLATAAAVAAAQGDITAIKAKTDNLPSGIKKNTALAKFTFLMVDSSDHVTPKTGLTVTAQRSLDGAAFGSCVNSPSEVGFGIYALDLDAGDLNGDVVTFRFTATGGDARLLTVVTEP
jgi:hypothetical protein